MGQFQQNFIGIVGGKQRCAYYTLANFHVEKLLGVLTLHSIDTHFDASTADSF